MPVSQKILDIRAKRGIGSVDNLLSIPKPKAPTAPVATPMQPVNYTSPTTAIGTGVSYEKNKPTLATRDNPMIAVSTKPTPVDINTADMSTLLKEQDAINFKIANNSFTQDDYVRGREISRKLAEQMYKVPEATANPYVSELEAKAQELKSKDYTPELTARKQQLEANFNIRKNQLEENARRARESTIGNIAMAGGGRSSVAQQAELDIQRQLADQISAEQAAMQQEILAYQRQLEGASSEELSSIYDTINQLKAQSSQGQQQLQQQSLAKQQEAVSQFDTSLQKIAQSRGIELDVNDEQAVAQMVKIARNPDGTVNENFLKTLAPQYQELVKAGVLSGIGVAQPASFTPKVERIGGTNKSPVYGYRDPNKQSFVTTNAQGVPTVRTGGGGSGGGTSQPGVEPKNQKLVELLNEYKGVLDSTTYIGSQLDPMIAGRQQSLLSEITAQYKNAQKLGTLDNGVITLMNGLLGKGGTARFSNAAQSEAVKGLIERFGGTAQPASQVGTTTAPQASTTATAPSGGNPLETRRASQKKK